MSAPDIFLSYNREDAERARQFAEGFAAQGLDVWWDVALRSGEAYDEVTEAALRNAKAVVVLWSPRSVDSRWVRAEATLADRRKTLMPAMIEPCERPIMFELVQTAELSHWEGDVKDAAWKSFAQHVRDFIGKEAVQPAPAKPAEPLPSLGQLSVAVLPFTNMGKDEEQEYFADGITEDVITDLGKVSALSVIARNTAFTFKDQLVDVSEVARKLNVTHVLEGSVRRAGKRVRVNVQLIDGSTGSQVWSERWDHNLDDIFELQDELSQEIVKALKVKLLPKERKSISSRGTENVEAYDLYLRAQGLVRSFGRDDARRAVELYQRALKLDPDFTLALHGLSIALTRAIQTTAGDPAQLFAEREAVFKRQLELAPDAWETQLAIGMRHLQGFRLVEAEQALFKAKEAAPASETRALYYYRIVLLAVGRVHDYLENAKAALRIEPLSIEVSFSVQHGFHNSGRLDEAAREYDRSNDLSGDRGAIEFFRFLQVAQRGDPDQTKRQYSRAVRHSDIAAPVLNKLLEVLEQPEAARAVIRDELDKPENQLALFQSQLAMLAALYGDADTALSALRRSYIDLQSVVPTQHWLPCMAEVRQDPRFKDLLGDIGVVDYWRESDNWGDFARPLGDDDFEIIA